MACNCGSGSAAASGGSAISLAAPPDPTKGKAPDGTPIGRDPSQGGTVPGYGSPGGGGSPGAGGGYAASGSEHATGTNATPPNKPTSVTPGLGGLSQQHESGGKGAAAIGQDKVGGYSYGTYQIATNTGTMNNYMNYLQKNDPDQLAALGSPPASVSELASQAKSGDPAFQAKWQETASNPDFAQSQHDFIQSTHYDPQVAKIQSETGLDVSKQPLGVQNAVWSTSVQNGGNTSVVTNALAGRDVASMSPNEITNAIYDERGKKNADGSLVYFGSSSPAVQASVSNRFNNERQGALAQNGGTQMVSNPTTTNNQTGI